MLALLAAVLLVVPSDRQAVAGPDEPGDSANDHTRICFRFPFTQGYSEETKPQTVHTGVIPFAYAHWSEAEVLVSEEFDPGITVNVRNSAIFIGGFIGARAPMYRPLSVEVAGTGALPRYPMDSRVDAWEHLYVRELYAYPNSFPIHPSVSVFLDIMTMESAGHALTLSGGVQWRWMPMHEWRPYEHGRDDKWTQTTSSLVGLRWLRKNAEWYPDIEFEIQLDIVELTGLADSSGQLVRFAMSYGAQW